MTTSPFLTDPRMREQLVRDPIVLVDVGAADFLGQPWGSVELGLRIVAFEPDARSEKPAVGGGVDFMWIPTAVGSPSESERTLYLTRKPQVSSLFRPNGDVLSRYPESSRFDVVAERPVTVVTLESALSKVGIPTADFLKLDVQGGELDVLRGSGEYGHRLAGFEVEVEFVELYVGQPLFANVHEWATENGYELFDLRPVYWKRNVDRSVGGPKGQLVSGDALYFAGSALIAACLAGEPDGEARFGRLVRILATILYYGYYDYALAVCESCRHAISPAHADFLIHSLRRSASRHVPLFRFRARLANLMRRLQDVVAPPSKDWIYGGRSLGNRTVVP